MTDNQLIYMANTALWTRWLAIGTFIMAGAVVATVIFALIAWIKSKRKDKQDITFKLLEEFLGLVENADYNELTEIENYLTEPGQVILKNFKKSSKEINPKHLVLFFAKMGKLLKDKTITISEIESYFYNYLLSEEQIKTLVYNIQSVIPKLPVDILNNFDFLLTNIGENKNIKSYIKLVGTSFIPSTYENFSVRILGELSPPREVKK